MEENFDFDAEFRVRLPSDLAERIALAAKENRRSRNLQYVYMLENWFELKNNLEERVNNIEALLNNK
jgi:predicted HicB family RNase H-like nuclease